VAFPYTTLCRSAALGNIFIAGLKGVAAFFSGNSSMFATSMHSLADSVNQGFVFIGSVLAETPPSERFPTGFGRVINIFCMVAVVVITILAYETFKEGWHVFRNPSESGNIRSEEHTSELQSRFDLVCRLLLE